MKIRSLVKAGVTTSGYRVCEDALCIAPNIHGVFDGATAATKAAPFVAQPDMTDAHWIANTASRLLPPHVLGASTEEVMPTMNTLLSNKFKEAARTKIPNIRADWLDATQCPATTASVAMHEKNMIHFLQVGDSPIMIKPKKGNLIVMEGDPVLLNHDREIHKVMQRLRENFPRQSLHELNKRRKKLVPCIRNRMNTLGGYGVLTVRESEYLPMENTSIPASSIESYVIMSDGLMELYDVFGAFKNFDEFYEAVTQDDGLETAHHALITLQKDDPEGQEFPRIKMGDDCAAIHCRL